MPTTPGQPRFASSGGGAGAAGGGYGGGGPSPPAWQGSPPAIEPPSAELDAPLDPDALAVMDVVLEKPEGAKLGVAVLPVCNGDRCELTVKRIAKGGVVDVWNQLAEKGSKIHQGDRILRVNSIEHDIDAMVNELQTSCEIVLLLSRSNRSVGVGAGTPPNAGSGSGEGGAASPPMPSVNRCSLTNIPPPVPPGEDEQQDTSPRDSVNNNNSAEHALGMPEGNGNAAQATSDDPLLTFEVEIEKPVGERLGMRALLVTGEAFNGFIVDRVIEGGCVDAWNQRSQFPYCVQALDCLVGVNGVSSAQSIANMANEFGSDARKITFTVQRREAGFANLITRSPTSNRLDADGMSTALQGLIQSIADLSMEGLPPGFLRTAARNRLSRVSTPPTNDGQEKRAQPLEDEKSQPAAPEADALSLPMPFGAGEQQPPAGPAALPSTKLFVGSAAPPDMPAPPEADAPSGMSLAAALTMAPPAPPTPNFNRGAAADPGSDEFNGYETPLKGTSDLGSSTQGSKDGDGQAEGSIDQSEDAKDEDKTIGFNLGEEQETPADSKLAIQDEAAGLVDTPPPPPPPAVAEEVAPKAEEAAPTATESTTTGDGEDSSVVSLNAKVLCHAVQLDDAEFVRFLKTALASRPGLSTHVAHALSAIKSVD